MKDDTSQILKDVTHSIDKINSIFSGMIDEFQNPVRFISQADSLIQALRNFTFILQSKKNSIDNFELWYSAWQELMKQNPYMRFIVEMRNSIVKQGINTAKSHVLIVLLTDYRQTILEKRLDIYTTDDEIIKELTRITTKKPELKHATAEIHRQYIFNYPKKDDLEVVDTLFYCTVFINELFEDFKNFITTGSTQQELPNVTAPNVDVSDLRVTFQLRDGIKIGKEVVTIERDDEAIKTYLKEYGDIELKHDINSDDIVEKLKAKIEFAQILRRQFDELIPSLEYHSVLTEKWVMSHPILRSRADKILFWKDFAEQIRREDIDKLFFTVDSWIMPNKKQFDKAMKSGEDIKKSSNLRECLVAYYLDSSGRIITARSSYREDNRGKLVFKNVELKDDTLENNAMFTAVFDAWNAKK